MVEQQLGQPIGPHSLVKLVCSDLKRTPHRFARTARTRQSAAVQRPVAKTADLLNVRAMVLSISPGGESPSRQYASSPRGSPYIELHQHHRSNGSGFPEEAAAWLKATKAQVVKAQAAQKRIYDRTLRHDVGDAGGLVLLCPTFNTAVRTKEAGPSFLLGGAFTVLQRVRDLASVNLPPSMASHGKHCVSYVQKVSPWCPHGAAECRRGQLDRQSVLYQRHAILQQRC